MKKNNIIYAGILMVLSALSITSIVLSSVALSNRGDNVSSSDKQDKDGITINISGAQTVEVDASINLAIEVLNDNDRLGYSISSSDETVATVSSTGTVTGIKAGTVTITVTSRKDDKIKKNYTITVIDSTIPTLKIESNSKSMKLSDYTTTFKANLKNPSGFDVKYEWSSKYGKGTFVSNGKESQTYRPFVEGPEIIVLDAYVGPYHLHEEMPFLIASNITGSWMAIETKDDFLNLVKGSSDMKLNYYLTSDIDLGGEVINSSGLGEVATFLGTLDGQGHKVSNFSIAGAGSGLFKKLGKNSAVRNLALECELGEDGYGWGTGVLASSTDAAFVENCSITVNHTYDNGLKSDANGWFAFNGVIAGSGSATITDCIINVLGEKATIYADFAYPAEGQGLAGYNAPSIKINGLYTNSTVVGGQQWDWGLAVMDQSGYVTGLDFATASKDSYKLNDVIWNVENNQMPTLKTQN